MDSQSRRPAFPAEARYRSEAAARGYDRARRGLARALERRAVRQLLKTLPPGRSMLDLPCGTGYFTALFAERFERVVGLDLSDAMLAEARCRLGSRAGVALLQGDACHLPFEDGAFDYSFSMRFFGHTPPEVRAQVLLELARVTRIAVLATLYVRGPLIALRHGLWRSAGEVGSSWHAFPSLGDATAELNGLGFRIDRIQPVAGPLMEPRIFVLARG